MLSSRSLALIVRSLASAASLAPLSLLLAGCAGYTVKPEPALALSAATFNFQTVVVGQKNTQTLHISNSGNAPLQVTALSISNQEFILTGPSLPRVILPALGLDYTLTFSPTVAGNASASLSITTSASTLPTQIALSGVGEKAFAALQITPPSLNFGNLTIPTTTTQNVSLQNTGDINLTIKGVTLVGSGFGYSNLSSGFTLTPNQKITFQVWFKPTAAGPYSGTVSFLSSNLSTPGTMPLSGDGVSSAPPPAPPPPVQHTVHLTWGASTSSVAGYRVYRGAINGGPYSPLTGTIDALTYSDSTVASGTTYYYVVTSVDSSGVESLDSNQATAPVPSN